MAETQQPPPPTDFTSIEINRIPVHLLLLDRQNPRLTLEDGDSVDQEELISLLWKTNAVDEIALSIASNGYYEDEPLLVIRSTGDTVHHSSFIVVEGNRRLAAIKILLDSALRNRLHADDLPAISEERKQELQTIPASLHASRQDLWTHVGFRHINGVKPWDGMGKSRYIAHIHEEYRIPLTEIASKIGDRHSTVRRLYRGYRVLRQAQTEADFDINDTYSGKFYFSHLYTALDQREYQVFLGLDPSDDASHQPIKQDKLNALRELMGWLFGIRKLGRPPLVGRQYPDLNYLREVISITQSLAAIRNGYPLDVAYSIALGDTHRFRESVFQASESLKEAMGTVSLGFSGEEEIREEVGKIHLLATKLRQEVDGTPRD